MAQSLPMAKVSPPQPDRRDFLRWAAGGTLLLSLGLQTGCSVEEVEEALRGHFKRLTPKEIDVMLKRLEKRYSEETGREVSVDATPAMEDVVFGYALDIARCIGCRQCVYACVEENNQSREPEIHWIRVLEMEKERGVDFEHANPYYDPKTVPEPGKFYLPVACQMCENPPCVKVCPVEATWQEPDGIVVIDYDWCIGCRYCIAACPYEARHFNWAAPKVQPEDLNPNTHYLGNRPRPKGVVEKCTFCIQRVRKGRYPACVEACPVGARKFGNLLDPQSEVRKVLKDKNVFTLKSELNTNPRFYYFYGVSD